MQVDRIEAIRTLAFKHVSLTLSMPSDDGVFDALPSVSHVERDGQVVTMRVSGPLGVVVEAATQYGLLDVVTHEPNLEDVFLAHYGRGSGTAAADVGEPRP